PRSPRCSGRPDVNSTVYSSTAYAPQKLKPQSAATYRSGLKRLAGRRLPWGNTQDVVPDTFMRPTPESLRFWEKESKRRAAKKAAGIYKTAPMERIDFHDRCDHEHYRYAPWAKRSQFWLLLHACGKIGFYLLLLIGVISSVLLGIVSSKQFLIAFAEYFLAFSYIPALCLFAWGLASLIIHKFRRLW